MLFPISKRKIGPGLKAGLKFAIFSNHNNVEIQFRPITMIATHVPKMPLDIELYTLIVNHLNVRYSTRSMFANAFFKDRIDQLKAMDMAKLIMNRVHTPFRQDTTDGLYKKAAMLIDSTFIDKEITEEQKVTFITEMVYKNGHEKHASIMNILDFIERNVKTQDVYERAVWECIRSQSFESEGNYRSYHTPSLHALHKFVISKMQAKQLSEYFLSQYATHFDSSLKLIEDRGQMVMVPRTAADIRSI